jgi:hypothetical protein
LAELRAADGRLRLSPDGASEAGLELATVVSVLSPDGLPVSLPIQMVEQAGETVIVSGAGEGFDASAAWRPADAALPHYQLELSVRRTAAEPRRAGLRLQGTVLNASTPRWLIPGLFYGENRLPHNRRIYPRWDPAGGDPDGLVSDSWSFRADRAALPAVFCWTDDACVCLWAEELGPLGEQGVGFRGDGRSAAIWLDAPYREEPVAYREAERADPPAVEYHDWQPGEEVTLRFAAWAGPPDSHAYDAVLREANTALRERNPLRPWLGPAEAAELTAHGLLRWHYRPEHGVLYETAAFERDAPGDSGDRPHMHVGWVSGAPWAAALLAYGRRAGHGESVEAGAAVLDTVSSGLAPCGAFWGEWRAGSGWSHGWNAGGQLHARTLSEATTFVARALAAERQAGAPHAAWESAVRSNLDFVLARQRPDGNCGAYYDPHSGEVAAWEGAAGLGWITALVEGAALVDEPAWLAAAVRAGGYYARFVEDELIYGAPEDVHLTPTSEDGYAAVMAYVGLHAATGERRWLELARRAADWMLTFRYAYNVSFSAGTTLAEYDFRTRGGDQASPSNQHLHAYGLICLPEMLALWRATGDEHYLARTRDNLACFFQFVARHDGDFGARRGMVSERFHQTDWAAPKGTLQPLSHAWSVGVVLHASLAALDDPQAFPSDWWQGQEG